MAKIKIYGNSSQLTEETDFEFLSTLDKYLSWTVPGAEYTRAFKGFVNKEGKFDRWDGTQRILTKKLTFPSGLVDRISTFYRDNGKTVEIDDQRPSKTPFTSIDIVPVLNDLSEPPYDHQLRALEAAVNNDRGILKLCTGAGKSNLAAMMAAHYNLCSGVFVIGKDLLYQFYELFCKIFGKENVGIVGDGNFKISKFNILSLWSCAKALGIDAKKDDEDDDEVFKDIKADSLKELLSNLKLAIFDECHMMTCTSAVEIYNNCNFEYIYGLSGTPKREDNSDLLMEGLLGGNIINISASELIEKKLLAKPIIKFINVPPPVEKLSGTYLSIYKQYIVDNDQRNGLIVKYAKLLTQQGYYTLVLFSNISHGKKLYKMIAAEMDCAMLDGSDSQDQRDAVKKRLMSGELKCVLASRIFEIGVNLPILSGLVIASAGKSMIKSIQRVGRVIRRYPGKEHAAIVDFVDNAKFLDKHSKIRYKTYKSEDGFDVSWIKKKK